MFASQKINTDPAPWVVAGYARNGSEATWRGQARDDDHAIEQADAALPKGYQVHTYGYAPRHNYSNSHNPILVEFRDRIKAHHPADMPVHAAVWVEYGQLGSEFERMLDLHGMDMARAYHDHARKVLERLAALA